MQLLRWLSYFSALVAFVGAGTILDILEERDDLSTAFELLSIADIDRLLDSRGPYTFFVPTNDAFDEISETVDQFEEEVWINHLQQLLLKHITGKKILSRELSVELSMTNLLGDPLSVTSSRPVTINGAEIIDDNIQATNGIVHTIGTVLQTSGTYFNVYKLASIDPLFSIATEIIKLADLVDFFETQSPLTVFAPIDSAFDQFSDEEMEFLMDSDNAEVLKEIILYHAGIGIELTKTLRKGMEIETRQGDSVRVTSRAPFVINDGYIVEEDIMVINGVIHVITSLLIPPSMGSLEEIIKSKKRPR